MKPLGGRSVTPTPGGLLLPYCAAQQIAPSRTVSSRTPEGKGGGRYSSPLVVMVIPTIPSTGRETTSPVACTC